MDLSGNPPLTTTGWSSQQGKVLTWFRRPRADKGTLQGRRGQSWENRREGRLEAWHLDGLHSLGGSKVQLALNWQEGLEAPAHTGSVEGSP